MELSLLHRRQATLAVCLLLGACGSPAPPSVGRSPVPPLPTPTPVTSELVSTTTPQPPSSSAGSRFQPFSIAAPGSISPSPDGRLVIAPSPSDASLAIFDDRAAEVARAAVTLPAPLFVSWLADSSAALVWGRDGPVSELFLVDRAGGVQDTNLLADGAEASSSGNWIASTRSSGTQGRVEVVARATLRPRTVASGPGVRFLGWIQEHIAFSRPSGIFLIDPSDGARARRIISASDVPVDVTDLRTPVLGGLSSPDGTLSVVQDGHGFPFMLNGEGIRAVPDRQYLYGDPVFWLGPHDVLAVVQNTVQVDDGKTGNLVRSTACGPVDVVDAGTPNGAIYRAGDDMHLCDLRTGQAQNLGSPPVAGLAQAFGDGYLFHGLGLTYLIVP